LGEQPLFAILQACDDFANHRVVDHIREDGTTVYFTMDHAPSTFRLLDQVKKCAVDARSEHYKIRRVLAITKARSAHILSAEEQAQVAEGLSALAKGMLRRATKEQEIDRQKISAEAKEARDRAARIIEEARRRNTELDAESQAEQ
jgi:hypothetical protein